MQGACSSGADGQGLWGVLVKEPCAGGQPSPRVAAGVKQPVNANPGWKRHLPEGFPAPEGVCVAWPRGRLPFSRGADSSAGACQGRAACERGVKSSFYAFCVSHGRCEGSLVSGLFSHPPLSSHQCLPDTQFSHERETPVLKTGVIWYLCH